MRCGVRTVPQFRRWQWQSDPHIGQQALRGSCHLKSPHLCRRRSRDYQRPHWPLSIVSSQLGQVDPGTPPSLEAGSEGYRGLARGCRCAGAIHGWCYPQASGDRPQPLRSARVVRVLHGYEGRTARPNHRLHPHSKRRLPRLRRIPARQRKEPSARCRKKPVCR